MLKNIKYLEKHWCEQWSVLLTKCPGWLSQQVFQGTSSVQCISTGALSATASVPNTVTECPGYCCCECQCSCKCMAANVLCLWVLLPVSQVSLQGLWMLSASVQGSVVVSATAGVSLPLSWMPITESWMSLTVSWVLLPVFWASWVLLPVSRESQQVFLLLLKALCYCGTTNTAGVLSFNACFLCVQVPFQIALEDPRRREMLQVWRMRLRRLLTATPGVPHPHPLGRKAIWVRWVWSCLSAEAAPEAAQKPPPHVGLPAPNAPRQKPRLLSMRQVVRPQGQPDASHGSARGRPVWGRYHLCCLWGR